MSRSTLHFTAASGVLLIAAVLYLWGQPAICTCGTVELWIGSIWDSGNSQHIADWYTLSHIIHGLLIGLAGRLLSARIDWRWAYGAAIVTGVGWEIIEHTDWVLDAFRATTINQGYVGDSVLNAVADYIWMLGGFFVASALKPWATLLVILGFEALAAFVARDSLALSTLSLLYPIEAVDAWQQELNPRAISPQE